MTVGIIRRTSAPLYYCTVTRHKIHLRHYYFRCALEIWFPSALQCKWAPIWRVKFSRSIISIDLILIRPGLCSMYLLIICSITVPIRIGTLSILIVCVCARVRVLHDVHVIYLRIMLLEITDIEKYSALLHMCMCMRVYLTHV